MAKNNKKKLTYVMCYPQHKDNTYREEQKNPRDIIRNYNFFTN